MLFEVQGSKVNVLNGNVQGPKTCWYENMETKYIIFPRNEVEQKRGELPTPGKYHEMSKNTLKETHNMKSRKVTNNS